MNLQSAARWFVAVILVLTGAWLTIGGGWLVGLGGSPYYVVTGAACSAAGVLIGMRRVLGVWIYGAVLAGTALWSVFEVGFDFWQLLPRLGGLFVLGLVVATPWFRRGFDETESRRATLALYVTAAAVSVLLVATFAAGARVPEGKPAASDPPLTDTGNARPDEWFAYGRTLSGTRYSPATQITPANVGKLKVAWTYQTGDVLANFPNSKSMFNFQATPLKVGDTLYLCTPHNIVVALDAETGQQRWRFDPGVDDTGALVLNCRGVSYHHAAEPMAECSGRILVATIDGRMLAVDAATGKRCQDFGQNGEISLHEGFGPMEPGAQYATSPPVVIGNAAVVGGYVVDNLKTKEPSGVVRAFDARSGKLLWAWDAGRPDDAELLKPGETYAQGSPNAWSILSADPDLGLVYVPTGNATPDYVGMHRTPLDARYSSSVVALDASTGRIRWHFQTAHHDIWDYDIASQPVLFDIPTDGGVVPALIQATKRGEIFLLDRRDGRPLAAVEERSVPRGDIPGEEYSPTQPYSTGFPSLKPALLTEAGLWGMTPLDQLWCRLEFRKRDYKGDFTPPSLRGSIQSPGNFGSVNWGSVSVDEGRHLLVVNSSPMPLLLRLVPRAVADQHAGKTSHVGLMPQSGTPYAADLEPFLSPLGTPCTAPPWGKLTAIDLRTREIVWQRPFGTTADQAPLGIAVPGVFSLGGPITTKTGVTFIAASLDRYLRAFDTRTGKELWRGRLPAGGQATPMTYTSERSGRQFVVIAAGGHQILKTKLGDYVVAYTLGD